MYKPFLGEIDGLKGIDGLYTTILLTYYQNTSFPGQIIVQILRAKFHVGRIDLPDNSTFIGDAWT